MFGAVVQLHFAGAAQHLGGNHLAAPLGRIDYAALPGRDLLQLCIGFMFIFQATHQAAAYTRDLRRVERQVLILCHIDRNRVEILQIRAATQLAPAGAQPADHLGLVAHADLPQLDARAEHARQIFNQLAEVDAPVGGKVEQHLVHVERTFRPNQIHLQPALLDLALADDKRVVRTLFVAHDRLFIRFSRHAHHMLERLDDRLVGHLGVALHALAVFQSARRFDDNVLARIYLHALRIKIIHFSARFKTDPNNRRQKRNPPTLQKADAPRIGCERVCDGRRCGIARNAANQHAGKIVKPQQSVRPDGLRQFLRLLPKRTLNG